MISEVRPIPEGMHSITPHIVCSRASEAIEFYKDAFDALEIARVNVPGGDKILHAVIKIGDSMVMIVDELPEWGTLAPDSLNGSRLLSTSTQMMLMPLLTVQLRPAPKSQCLLKIHSGVTAMQSLKTLPVINGRWRHIFETFLRRKWEKLQKKCSLSKNIFRDGQSRFH